jgi:hypothetical protein
MNTPVSPPILTIMVRRELGMEVKAERGYACRLCLNLEKAASLAGRPCSYCHCFYYRDRMEIPVVSRMSGEEVRAGTPNNPAACESSAGIEQK